MMDILQLEADLKTVLEHLRAGTIPSEKLQRRMLEGVKEFSEIATRIKSFHDEFAVFQKRFAGDKWQRT
jgi:hypothetical protein